MRNDKKIMALLILITAIALAGCNPDVASQNLGKTAPSNTTVEKIEIYHFHATQQCYSCKTVGAYAEETVSLFFSEQKKSGKIVFDHINIDLPENAELAKKYGVTGSSLWIGVYDSSGFHKEENTQVWYKIDNKDNYLLYLKLIIDKRLNGDYTQ
ncbi:MAG: nitrophenyl compound nitroreductase subunit ArsF family protein [archaeon]